MENKIDDKHYSNKIFKESLRDELQSKNYYKQYNNNPPSSQHLKSVDVEKAMQKRKEIENKRITQNENRYKQHALEKNLTTKVEKTVETPKKKIISHLKQSEGESQVKTSLTESKVRKITAINGSNPVNFLNESELKKHNEDTKYSSSKTNAVKNIYSSSKLMTSFNPNEKVINKSTNIDKITNTPSDYLQNFDKDIKKHAVKHHFKYDNSKFSFY